MHKCAGIVSHKKNDLTFSQFAKMASKHPEQFCEEAMPVWKIRLPFTSTRGFS